MKNLIIFIVLLSFFSCRSVKRDIVVDRQDETIISIKKDSVTLLVNTDFTNGRLAISGFYMI